MANNPIVDRFNLLSSKVETIKDNLKKLQARQTALTEQKNAILLKLQADFGITSYEQLTSELQTLTDSLTQSLSTMETILSKVTV
jgi:predicted  nucleic acid-binding Zn-ribbon protein